MSTTQKKWKNFSQVKLRFSIISTNNLKKESGKWAKISNNSYIFYIQNDKIFYFHLEMMEIFCKSKLKLCKKLNNVLL